MTDIPTYDVLTTAKRRTVHATAHDKSVPRFRCLVLTADSAADQAYGERRAEWESRVRAAKGDTATVTVQGWRMPDGKLWPVNRSVEINCPSCRLFGWWLIGDTEFTRDDSGGTITILSLKRPDTYLYKLDKPKKDAHKGGKKKHGKKGKGKAVNAMEGQMSR